MCSLVITMNASSSASLLALHLNNEGVTLLLQNRDKEATPYFSKSLALMKTTLMNSASDTAESAMIPRLVVCHDASHPLPNFPRDINHSFLCTLKRSHSPLSSRTMTVDWKIRQVFCSVQSLSLISSWHITKKPNFLDGKSAF